MKKYKIGDRIAVIHKLERRKTDRHRNWTIKMLPKPVMVTVVGIRILWNGYVRADGNFVRTTHKRAVMVAPNLQTTFYMEA